jgi:hypothetical protein
MTFDENVMIVGPSFDIELSCLDACHPVHYSRRLLIFRCTSNAERDAQLAALKVGLQALVLRCPPLAGVITHLPPNMDKNVAEEWRTIVPGPGLELVVRDLGRDVPSFEELKAADFPSVNLPYNLLVPIPHNIDSSRPFDACKIQFTAIEGGSIITFAMSHCVADGGGTNELLRILSEETRLAQQHSIEDLGDRINSDSITAVTGLDRSIISGMVSEIPFHMPDHPGYRSKPPASNESPLEEPQRHPFQASSPETSVIYTIPASALAQLKADATPPGTQWISTHDALSALLWRTTILIRRRRSEAARRLPDSTTCSIFMPSDARHHLNIPDSYVGNAVYQLAASIDLGTLLSQFGLQQAALAIRHAITAASTDLVTSYVAKLKEGWIEWQFLSSASTTGVAMGTDWTSGTLYGLDWGESFGPMIRYRYPGGVGEAFHCIMPKLPDEGAELMVSMMSTEVDELNTVEDFIRYIKL